MIELGREGKRPVDKVLCARLRRSLVKGAFWPTAAFAESSSAEIGEITSTPNLALHSRSR